MAKRKPIIKESFNSEGELDRYLESADLGDIFKKYGKVHQPKVRKVNVDLPIWLISQLDLEAARAGVSRQPLIKLWLIQKLDDERKKRVGD